MKSLKRKRLILILLITISLVIQLLLFGSIKNIQLAVSSETLPFMKIFLFILILVVISVILVVLLLRDSSGISENMHKSDESNNESSSNITEKVETTKTTSTHTIDFKAGEIIPKEKINKLEVFSEKVLINISKKIEITQGLIFVLDQKDQKFKVNAKYAYVEESGLKEFISGETLPGQVVKDKHLLNITELPKEYIRVFSGLGDASPKNLIIFPAIVNGDVLAIFELSSFKPFEKDLETIFEQIGELYGQKLLTFNTSA